MMGDRAGKCSVTGEDRVWKCSLIGDRAGTGILLD